MALTAAAAAATTPIRFVEVDGATVVEVELPDERLAELERRLPDDWSALFAVYTEEASLAGDALPPLLGSYSLTGSAVRFTPRFDLAQGIVYVARWSDPADPAGDARARFEIPRPELPPSTALVGVYPSGAEVPENLLRIYLQFSAPMSQGRVHERVRLLHADGEPVESPFVAPERELWSPDGTRLTLFFDPGRIKRGVGPNLEAGPPLRAGGRYRLEIDHELADARGVPLVRDYFKELTVSAPDRDQPRTEEWRLEPPRSSTDPVRLDFPEPLDHGLLTGLLFVLDESGAPVEGETTVHRGETAWSFRPRSGWGEGVYRVRVSTLLEDLGGNSLRRPFEVAIAADGRVRDEGEGYLDLPFALDAARP